MRFRSRVLPDLGRLEVSAVTPSALRGWDRRLREDGLSDRYRHTLFTNLSALFAAARDDGLIAKNPFDGKSLRKPWPAKHKVMPWPEQRVWAVQDALPERFRVLVDLAAGIGLRQGECFGLAVEDVDFLRGVVHVRRQVKTVRYKRVFALPQYDKEREIPLSEPVKLAIAAHLRRYPPLEVGLPWNVPGGRPTTARLIVSSVRSLAIAANDFNRNYWKGALDAADVPHARYENGMHGLRHFFASALLDQGESIKAVAEWLGHTDPAFTLATYTPDAQQRRAHQVRRRRDLRSTGLRRPHHGPGRHRGRIVAAQRLGPLRSTRSSGRPSRQPDPGPDSGADQREHLPWVSVASHCWVTFHGPETAQPPAPRTPAAFQVPSRRPGTARPRGRSWTAPDVHRRPTSLGSAHGRAGGSPPGGRRDGTPPSWRSAARRAHRS